MNLNCYPPIIDSMSSLAVKKEVEMFNPLPGNMWLGIYDEPENTIEKFIQDSFDFYFKDTYNFSGIPFGKPVGFEWWFHKFDEEVNLAYTTYGKLSESGDNAILVFHALTGSHLLAGNYEQFEDKNLPWNDELEIGWWDEFVGSGKMIDTDNYFVICVNYVGGCYGSTGPSSINKKTNNIYADSFPDITFKDIENSQKLVCDMLGVKSLHAVAGASIGGLMALEFAITYPEYVNKIILVADNFTRVMDSISLTKKDNNDSVKPLIEGIELIFKDFLKTLEKFEIKQIDCLGKKFDPNFHQAVSEEINNEIGRASCRERV